MLVRPRRLRQNNAIRNLIQENILSTNDLIAPLFVMEGKNKKTEIKSMPGQYRFTLDLLIKEIDELVKLGIKCISLFPVVNPKFKSNKCEESYNPKALNQIAIIEIRKKFKDLLIMSDVALDPYSIHGHDGLVDESTGEILNDETVEVLCKMALAQAKAGTNIIGPSDMMDGRVKAIREALDKANFQNVMIMSYTAKYASAFYGPFRDALDSAPKKGDKKTYQMDFANSDEALKEAKLDLEEGADIIMVKPGLSYLDIIHRLKKECNAPIAAYNVSGEYAMVVAACENGWLNRNNVIIEMLTSFKRAGADLILTYFAKEAAKLLKEKK